MKRCSTCNRTFTDPNLRFCIDDGTPLTDVEPEYQPPRSYVPPAGEVRKRRRAWPWLVGIGGAFILGILAIGIAGLVLAPRIARRMEQANSNANRRVENSNTPTNTNATENVDAPVPTNQEQVLTQLKDIENEWTVANLNADKKKLDRILADDFVGHDEDGQPQSKADYIRTIERNTNVDKWEFSDLKLMQAGDRVTLTGKITYFVDNRQAAFDFIDKFVWREGRWQATGAEIKEAENTGTSL